MADRYWVAGGTGNYSSTTNWSATSGGASGASVPVAADNVFFNAASGAGTATINGVSNCRNLNLTGFLGTLAFTSATLQVNGTIMNFGLGTYTITGTQGLLLATAMTITSNGTIYTGNITFSGAVTYTLADNMSVSGTVTSTNANIINGNTLNIGGNFTHAHTSNITGTTIFNFNGTGTWSNTNTGALRNNTTINTAGTLTLGTNVNYNTGTLTYTAGTVVTTGSTLNIGASTTLNTNGITWNNITILASITITLGSNLTLIGDLRITAVGSALSFTLGGFNLIITNANIIIGNLSGNTFNVPQNLTCINLTCAGSGTLNGNQLSITGNLTVNGVNNINQGLVGTTNLVLTGTGTWSSTLLGPVTNNLTINTAGTITISGSVYFYGEISTRTLTYIAGTVVTTGSTLFLGSGGNPTTGTTLNTNGIIWNNVTTFGTSGATTITNTSNLTIANDLSLTSSNSAVTLNSSSIFVGGNLTVGLAGNIASGTSTIVLNGTGTWSSVSTSSLRNNLTINTSGTITLGTNIYYNTGTLTYISGTVITTGNTLFIGAATTLNTNGITWNNISAVVTINITLGSDLTLTGALINGVGGATTLSFTLGGNSLISTNANLTLTGNSTFTMPANQTFKTLTSTGTGGTINTNTLTITENLTINGTVSGTTAIIYAGTGTWTALNSGDIINSILTINTLGTLTISGIVYKGGGLFTYTAGTIDDTSGTVAVQQATLNISGFTFRKLLVNNTITLASNLNATTFGTWGANATTFVLGGNTLNFTNLELGNTGTTTLPTAWVCQNIEFVNNSSGVLTGNSITINGNILQSGGSSYSGTTTFTYAGTGTWTAPANGFFLNSFTINTAGTLTFISGNIGAGIFTYTAGTVITTGSILTIRGNGTTMNHGAIVWWDVTTPINVISLILNNQLVCSNALTVDNSQINFSGTDGTFDVYYLNLNSSGTIARNPKLVATKTYRVRAGFTSQGTLAFPITLSSTVAASQAIFTVDPGATIDVGFVNATDIDSSLGRRIYSYRGVFSNTSNWALLPTDVTPSSGVFVN